MIQRYDLGQLAKHYASDKDNVVCRAYDVEKLEDKYCKLLEAHMIMKEALEWLTTDACLADYSHMSKRDFAVKTLKRVAEVMP